MATEAQISANRQNAEKSTGPRTDEGKAVVSKNAVKHGLFVTPMVITGEDQERFDLQREALLGDLRPLGPLETMLAERMIGLSWRLDRAVRMQNQAIEEMIEGLKPTAIAKHIWLTTPPFLRGSEQKFNVPEPEFALGRVAENDCANYRVLERLMIYERRMESSLLKMMRNLKKLQIVRRIEREEVAEQTPAEEAVIANPRAYLAKQTQFASAMEDAKAYARKGYDDKPRPGARENKPKQSQFRDSGSTIHTGQTSGG